MVNKKIRNATVTEADGITFKSKFEKSCYLLLKGLNIDVRYEPHTFIIWEGFEPITPFYDKESDRQRMKKEKKGARLLVLKNTKVQPIKYTPDLYFRYKGYDVWIELKSIENDVFYIKKKMFRKYLDDLFRTTGQKSIYFEVYTKTQLLQTIEIVKQYTDERL